tara:strand:+ start:432 stop:713 length:282 start_codon:yes stop_codon:yes gene_type:complete
MPPVRRDYKDKRRLREEAEARAEKYKQPKNPKGMREKIKRGLMSIDEALDVLSTGILNSENFSLWLLRKKKSGFKFKVVTKKRVPKKKTKKDS